MIAENETSFNWWEIPAQPPEFAISKNELEIKGQEKILFLPQEPETVLEDGFFLPAEKPKRRKFAEQLNEHIFQFLTVFLEKSVVRGILVGVFHDFLVLVNKCFITEIPFKEIQAVRFTALGCPVCQRPKKTSQFKSLKKDSNQIETEAETTLSSTSQETPQLNAEVEENINEPEKIPAGDSPPEPEIPEEKPKTTPELLQNIKSGILKKGNMNRSHLTRGKSAKNRTTRNDIKRYPLSKKLGNRHVGY